MKKVRSVQELFTHIRNDIKDYKERLLGRLSRTAIENIRSKDKEMSLEVSEIKDGVTIRSEGSADAETVARRTLTFAETATKLEQEIPRLSKE